MIGGYTKMHYETNEAICQLKAKLEDFEHSNRVAETWFVKGLFYAITLLESGKEYADQKLSNDSIRFKSSQIDELLDKDISVLSNPNVSVETLTEVHDDLITVKDNLLT